MVKFKGQFKSKFNKKIPEKPKLVSDSAQFYYSGFRVLHLSRDHRESSIKPSEILAYFTLASVPELEYEVFLYSILVLDSVYLNWARNNRPKERKPKSKGINRR